MDLSLPSLARRVVHELHQELREKADILKGENDRVRRQQFLSFFERARQIIARVYVLSRWAGRNLPLLRAARLATEETQRFDSSCKEIYLGMHLSDRLLYESSYRWAPLWDIQTAIRLCSHGLPQSVHLMRKEMNADFRRYTLDRLSQFLRLRLLRTLLPEQFSRVHVDCGVVTLTVEKEFEARLTVFMHHASLAGSDVSVTDDSLSTSFDRLEPLDATDAWVDPRDSIRQQCIKWTVVDWQPLFGVGPARPFASSLAMSTAERHAVQSHLNRRLFINDRPLHLLYDALHWFCASLKLDLLASQTRDLPVDTTVEYHRHEKLLVSFWPNDPASLAIAIESDSFLCVSFESSASKRLFPQTLLCLPAFLLSARDVIASSRMQTFHTVLTDQLGVQSAFLEETLCNREHNSNSPDLSDLKSASLNASVRVMLADVVLRLHIDVHSGHLFAESIDPCGARALTAFEECALNADSRSQWASLFCKQVFGAEESESSVSAWDKLHTAACVENVRRKMCAWGWHPWLFLDSATSFTSNAFCLQLPSPFWFLVIDFEFSACGSPRFSFALLFVRPLASSEEYLSLVSSFSNASLASIASLRASLWRALHTPLRFPSLVLDCDSSVTSQNAPDSRPSNASGVLGSSSPSLSPSNLGAWIPLDISALTLSATSITAASMSELITAAALRLPQCELARQCREMQSVECDLDISPDVLHLTCSGSNEDLDFACPLPVLASLQLVERIREAGCHPRWSFVQLSAERAGSLAGWRLRVSHPTLAHYSSLFDSEPTVHDIFRLTGTSSSLPHLRWDLTNCSLLIEFPSVHALSVYDACHQLRILFAAIDAAVFADWGCFDSESRGFFTSTLSVGSITLSCKSTSFSCTLFLNMTPPFFPRLRAVSAPLAIVSLGGRSSLGELQFSTTTLNVLPSSSSTNSISQPRSSKPLPSFLVPHKVPPAQSPWLTAVLQSPRSAVDPKAARPMLQPPSFSAPSPQASNILPNNAKASVLSFDVVSGSNSSLASASRKTFPIPAVTLRLPPILDRLDIGKILQTLVQSAYTEFYVSLHVRSSLCSISVGPPICGLGKLFSCLLRLLEVASALSAFEDSVRSFMPPPLASRGTVSDSISSSPVIKCIVKDCYRVSVLFRPSVSANHMSHVELIIEDSDRIICPAPESPPESELLLSMIMCNAPLLASPSSRKAVVWNTLDLEAEAEVCERLPLSRVSTFLFDWYCQRGNELLFFIYSHELASLSSCSPDEISSRSTWHTAYLHRNRKIDCLWSPCSPIALSLVALDSPPKSLMWVTWSQFFARFVARGTFQHAHLSASLRAFSRLLFDCPPPFVSDVAAVLNAQLVAHAPDAVSPREPLRCFRFCLEAAPPFDCRWVEPRLFFVLDFFEVFEERTVRLPLCYEASGLATNRPLRLWLPAVKEVANGIAESFVDVSDEWPVLARGTLTQTVHTLRTSSLSELGQYLS